MQTRAEITDIVRAINAESPGASVRLQDEDLAQLESILQAHPELWPMGLVDTFKLLQGKLRLESIERKAIPEALVDFFDQKFRRDVDPMALARQMGQDLCSSCEDCGCRC